MPIETFAMERMQSTWENLVDYDMSESGVRPLTMRELVEMTLRLIGRRRLLIPIPFAVARVQARLFEFFPSPPLTTSQVDLLRTDNVVSGVLRGFRELGIEPKGVEEVVPTYIGRSHVPEPH